jgi:hypothetical protein
MTKTITDIIRIVSSLVLCYLIYKEAGIYTGIFAVLVLVGIESITIILKDTLKNVELNNSIIQKLLEKTYENN